MPDNNTTTGVYPVYENQFKIDVEGGNGTNDSNQKTIADCTTFSVSIDGKVQEWDSFTEEGWTRRLVTGKSISITINAKRNIGDPGNDYVDGLALKTGADASTTLSWNFPSGAKLVIPCVVNVTNWGGGEAVDVAPLEFECLSNGKPTFTPAAA
ncbi:MAG: hypothetical protein IJ723_03375 [Ruminococcus sp.]|nr:hypothetical protein [Ruminococcus sp.]